MFSCKYGEFFKNTYFEEHLQTVASGSANVCFWPVKSMMRSSRPDVLCKKSVLRNFTKFTGKHMCQSFFFNNVAHHRPATLLKKRLWRRCFPVNFVEFLWTPFFRTPQAAASEWFWHWPWQSLAVTWNWGKCRESFQSRQ